MLRAGRSAHIRKTRRYGSEASINTFYWIGGDGDFSTASDWDTYAPDTSDPSGFGVADRPPEMDDDVVFNRGGTVVASGTVDSVLIQTTVFMSGEVGAETFSIANAGTLVVGRTLDVGAFTDVYNGSSLIVAGGYLTAAAGLDVGSSFFNLSSSGASSSVTVSSGGTISVGIAVDGSVFGSFSLDEATAYVEGAGALLSSGGVEVGDGSLTVSNGGSVYSAAGIYIGGTGSGLLTISDHASGFAAGAISVGHDAGSFGTLDVDGGASLSNLGTGDTIAGTIGEAAGSSAAATVDGAGSQWTTEDLTVAEDGDGRLTISDAGYVRSGSVTDLVGDAIGQDAGSAGEVTVDGPGSRWDSEGFLGIGVEGTGVLVVSDDGRVSGVTSIYVAEAGSGTLDIESGGDAESRGSAIVGFVAGSRGAVTVDGSGSMFEDSGSLIIGRSGSGMLTVTNAGTVTSAGCGDAVGGEVGGVGQVTVDGASSLWSSAGSVTVGALGAGALTVSDGGAVKATSIYDGSHGTVSLAGGTLDSPLTIAAGGELVVRAGSRASAIDGPVLNSGTIIVDDGGDLDAPDGVTGPGLIVVEPGGTIDDGGSVQIGPVGTLPAAGDAFVWVGPLSGSWGTAANWKNLTTGANPAAAPPGAADSATFDSPSGATQVIAGVGEAASLTLNGDNDVTGQVTTAELAAGGLGDPSTLSVSAGGKLAAGSATLIDETATVTGGSFTASGLTLAGSAPAYQGTEASLAVRDGGVVQAGALVVDDVGLSVDATSSIEVGAAGDAAKGDLTVDAGATLTLLDARSAFAGPLLAEGGVVDDGTITVAPQSDAAGLTEQGSGAGASGDGAIVLQDEAQVSAPLLAGTLSVRLGRSATLTVSNAASGDAIALSGGDDVLAIDASSGAGTRSYAMLAEISGFDGSDMITIDSPVTGAVYTAGSASGTGTLTLSDGGTAVTSLTLLGSYAGDTFLAAPLQADPTAEPTTAIVLGPKPAGPGPSAGTATGDSYTWIGPADGDWNTAANWSDLTTGASPAAVAPGSKDQVTIPAAAQLAGVIQGDGDSASLVLGGDQIVTGHLTTGTLAVPGALDSPHAPFTFPGTSGSPSLTIAPGASVTAATATADVNSSVFVDGGSLDVAGTLGFYGYPENYAPSEQGSLSASLGAHVQVGTLDLSDARAGVDSTSSIEVGHLGGAAPGAITVDPGAVLYIVNLVADNEAIDSGRLIDNGGVLIGLFGSVSGYDAAPGGVSGIGSLGLGMDSSANLSKVAVTGSLSIQLDNGATLTVGSVGADDTISLAGSDTLAIMRAGGTYAVQAKISGLDGTDGITFDTAGLTPSYTAGGGSLAVSGGGSVVATLNLAGDFTGDLFLADPTSSGGTQVSVADASVSAAAGKVTVVPAAGATVSLNAIVDDPVYAAAAAEKLVIDGPGTVAATGSLSIADVELVHGTLVLDGVTIATDPITVDAGAAAGGSGKLTGSIEDDGAVTAQGGALELTGAVSGTGALAVDAGATLRLDGPVAAGLAIGFAAGGGETLALGAPLSTGATISGFVGGDAITFAGTYGTVARSFSGDVMTVTGDGGVIAKLTFGPGYDDANTSVVDQRGTVTVDTILCFAAGTLIATDRGEAPVETLRPGDPVAVLDGGGRSARPVRWIGRRRLDLARHPRPELARPIRIRRGAFADGLPRRDLLVSPEHCIFVDGVLIPARLLVNGGSIVQDDGVSRIEYVHVELDRHAVLLAEGLPTESYLDTGNRGAFDGDGPCPLHPEFAVDAGHASWATHACAPLAVDPATVRPVWGGLRERSAAAGFRPAPVGTTADPALRLHADGLALRPAFVDGGRRLFVLPRPASELRLVSRAARPSGGRPWLDDRRMLGVCVRRIAVPDGAGGSIEIRMDRPFAGRGWHEAEGAGSSCFRWTDGCAQLPGGAGTGVLEVELAGGMRYPTADLAAREAA